MKSIKQKEGESRPIGRPRRRSAPTVTDLPVGLLTESDLSAVQSTHQQRPLTAEKPLASPPPPLELERYQKHAIAIAIVMASFHLRHLSRLYREFDGDLIMPIILGEIGHYNLTQFFSSDGYAMNHQEIPNPLLSSPLLRPCNAFSISEATGIPRETVRRKVEKLIAMGWLRRDSRGHLFITEKPQEQFVPEFNLESLKELLYTSDRLRQILSSD